MNICYNGKYWLKNGFMQPGLWEFIKTTKEKLAKPLELPDYATAAEEERLEKTNAYFKKNIYAYHNAIHDHIDRIDEGVTKLRPVYHGNNPLLYDLAMFAAKTLCNAEPIVYLYTAKTMGYIYQACAIDYLNKAYIYISDVFANNRILSSEEMLYLLGHELGHTQCHHSTLGIVTKETSVKDEYSADRAGLIACGKWLHEKYPDMSFEEIGKRSVNACVGTMEKISKGNEALRNNSSVDWHLFDNKDLFEQIDDIFRNSKLLGPDGCSHPHTARRYMAAAIFAESEMFCRYMNFEPTQYNNLYSDKQLENAMYQL